eukprot:973441-Pelagomonas_calceolata.AAC.4
MSWAIEQAGLKDAGKAGMRWAGNKLDSSLGSGKAGQRHRHFPAPWYSAHPGMISWKRCRCGCDQAHEGRASQQQHAQGRRGCTRRRQSMRKSTTRACTIGYAQDRRACTGHERMHRKTAEHAQEHDTSMHKRICTGQESMHRA